MSSHFTLEEAPAQGGQRRRLLSVVLRYDDLLRECTGVIPLEGPGARGAEGATLLRLGRAEGELAPPGWRLAGCELSIADRWLSGAHARLERSEKGQGSEESGPVLLRDLSSRNGTFVNGRRVSVEPLQDGDLIEVGHTLLCYRDLPSLPPAQLAGDAFAFLGPTATVCPEVALLVRDLTRVAPSRESVLLLAETGAGKEVVAELLHRLSGRPGPFVAVDCGAVPESLFESAFFGHQRGAFTGAAGAQVGYLQRAHRGTLFLDEVANMTATAQAKLLRVLEDGRVTPLGAERAVAVDLRVVAATNVDLLAVASLSALGSIGAAPSFRSDLLRRLAGYVGRIPPLRRRREDLGFLSAYLLRQAGVERAAISSAAGRRLFCSLFPGNVRELRAVLRSAALLAGADPIDVAHLSTLTPSAGEAAGLAASQVSPVYIDNAGTGDPSGSYHNLERGISALNIPDLPVGALPLSPEGRARPGGGATPARATSVPPRGALSPPLGARLPGLSEPRSAASTAPPRPPVADNGRDVPSRETVDDALRACGGNVVHAARRLSTHPRQLYRWIERHGLILSQYRGR